MQPASTRFATPSRGLDTDLYPMRLWKKAKQLGTWDPEAIDFNQDKSDWQALSDRERDLVLRLTAQFAGGDESVTYDLLPLLQVMAEEGRIEEEMFLTAYLWEEAKHVEGFSRFLAEVAGVRGGLEGYFTEAYRTFFEGLLPQAMARIRTDRHPVALAEAVVTYQMVTEGVLAETGYHAYYTVLARNNILPGMRHLVQHIQRDEARHIGYGVFLLSRLIVEHGDEVWEAVQNRMNQLLPLVFEHISQTLIGYGDDVPFDVKPDDFLTFGLSQFQKRAAHLERARTQSLHEILYRGERTEEVAAGEGRA